MGRGDRYQQPSFSVPCTDRADVEWPFPDRAAGRYCLGCGRSPSFCECPQEKRAPDA